MLRSIAASTLAALMLSSASVAADARPDPVPVTPSAAAAKAGATDSGRSSASVRTLFATYGVVQGLDMASTMVARNRGAVETNPLMRGSYARGIAVKSAVGALTLFAVRAVEKKNKKAAVITMIAMNVGTAMVVANNIRVARRLK